MISLTPWFERKFDFNFAVGYFPIIVERLRATIPHVADLMSNCPDENLIRKPNAEWSVKEHVGHLYDLEELWFGRVEDFLAGRKQMRAADLRNEKTHQANHNIKSPDLLMSQFAGERTRLIDAIKNIDATTATKTSLHPRLQTPMRLIDFLFFVAEHDDHHCTKIRLLVAGS